MITVWPTLFRPGDGARTNDRAIVERARAPRIYQGKADVPRWSGAEFLDGYRDLASWRCSWWIVLDLDAGATSEQIATAFGDWTGFAHTTWSSTTEVQRWRVAGMLDRSVDQVEEWERVWRAAAARAEAAGLAPDFGARDASRAWALPARHDGDAYEHVELRGALFDVDEALSRFPKPEPMSEPRQVDRSDSYDRRLERAAKYLATMPGAISGSGGHAATFKAALVLVRGFELDPDDALRLLVEEFNPRCAPAWSAFELRHKVKSAGQRARLPSGWLMERRAA